MFEEFEGKTLLVTGASSGIGAAVALSRGPDRTAISPCSLLEFVKTQTGVQVYRSPIKLGSGEIQTLADNKCRERENTAAQPFPDNDHIRLDIEILEGEHFTGPAETVGNLIENK